MYLRRNYLRLAVASASLSTHPSGVPLSTA